MRELFIVAQQIEDKILSMGAFIQDTFHYEDKGDMVIIKYYRFGHGRQVALRISSFIHVFMFNKRLLGGEFFLNKRLVPTCTSRRNPYATIMSWLGAITKKLKTLQHDPNSNGRRHANTDIATSLHTPHPPGLYWANVYNRKKVQ